MGYFLKNISMQVGSDGAPNVRIRLHNTISFLFPVIFSEVSGYHCRWQI
jgi:hypothetical protein